jgi:hydrogenase maturation protease
MNTTLSILGVGSPFGDDRVGWLAVDLLAANPNVIRSAGQIVVRRLDRPGMQLLAEFGISKALILIDAMCSGALPGTIRRMQAEELCTTRTLFSSHGLGVAQAVGLARQLGGLPTEFVCFGLEVGNAQMDPDLSAAVMAALPQLVEQVIQQATAWGAVSADAVDSAAC